MKRRPKRIAYSDLPKIRETLLKQQNGFCPICDRKVVSPVVDHEHVKRIGGSGRIRGVLCSTCNVFLAKIENNAQRYRIPREMLPSVLVGAARYLTTTPLPILHPSENPKPPKLQKASYNELKRTCDKLGLKIPPFPARGYLTKPLMRLYEKIGIVPKFYK